MWKAEAHGAGPRDARGGSPNESPLAAECPAAVSPGRAEAPPTGNQETERESSARALHRDGITAIAPDALTRFHRAADRRPTPPLRTGPPRRTTSARRKEGS